MLIGSIEGNKPPGPIRPAKLDCPGCVKLDSVEGGPYPPPDVLLATKKLPVAASYNCASERGARPAAALES